MRLQENKVDKKDLNDLLKSLQKDKNGDFIVPEGFEIYQVPSKQEIIQGEILRLEKELEGMSEPTDEELIEEGKMMHPYYSNLDILNHYKAELIKL